MAEAAADHRPASQVVGELMRDYIASRKSARAYGDYLRCKVEIARVQRAVGLHGANEEVEAEAVARRAELLRRADAAGV